MQKYSVNQQFVNTILSWVEAGEIAIPEIQRPIVWSTKKIRDLIDSLYQGYPIGYIIIWRNPNVKLKDGSMSNGKKIVIDGQQRIAALRAAVLGKKILNKEYSKVRVKISFNPITEEFETQTPAIKRDPKWINDISVILSQDSSLLSFVTGYLQENSGVDKGRMEKNIEKLIHIKNSQIGIIELDSDLDVETVTDIFVRINSEGVPLSQADFAMSKIAANETCGGPLLRKCIDYFSHLSNKPEFYEKILEKDKDFVQTDYFPKLSWLKRVNMELFVPSYKDILRVSFTSEFERGKLKDLVSLLSGRNFETREYEEEIMEKSFSKLRNGVLEYINETNFQRFVMIIRSAGFVDSSMIRSKNVVNFVHILYLVLRKTGFSAGEIESYVRRWFVLSVLTKRYSGSPESMFDFDIKRAVKNFPEFLTKIEQGELSQAFWDVSLVESLNTSITSSPFFHVFLASQVKERDKGFLSREITVADLITHKGDVHHIFPRAYLKRHSLKRSKYNQIANYAYMQSEINIKVGAKSPKKYFDELRIQSKSGELQYGGIKSEKELLENLRENSVPKDIFEMDIENYDDFLQKRRILMAEKIKNYYFSL